MLIDKTTILSPGITLDCMGHMASGSPPIFVLQFSHLEQSDDVLFCGAKRVRKGKNPTMRYVRAIYKPVRMP